VTDRPIFTIDLDDAAFKSFAETFKRFQAESEKVKNTWKANDHIIDLATKNFKAMGGEVAAPAKAKSETAADAMQKWSSAGWGSIGSGAKTLATHVRSATTMLAKWTGITAVFGSLIAAGGIYGVSQMAMGVSARRTSAAGIGTTYSAQEAASAAFVGIPDASKIIHSLSEATASQNGMAPLFALMGGQAEGLRGGDPVENFVKILPHLKRMADQESSWGSMGERLRAMGLDKIGVSMETLRLLKAFKPGELDHMIKRYREAEPSMRLSRKDQKALQDFDTVLEQSEQSIKMLFGVNLVKMVPAVEVGTKVFTAAIEEILKDGGPAGDLLQGFGKGIIKFSKWIDTPDIEGQVVKFSDTLFEFSSYEKYGPELKILLSAFAGWQVGGIWGAGVGAAVAVGSMWDGPDTPYGRAQEHASTKATFDRMRAIKHEHDTLTPGRGIQLPKARGAAMPVGWTAPGLKELEQDTQEIPGGRRRISAENDEFHHRVSPGSAHVKGLAFDQSLYDPSMHAQAAEYMRSKLRAGGLSDKEFRVIDEYAHPSAHSTGGHIHSEFSSAEAAKRYKHPQLQGEQSHVEVHDDSAEGVHVLVDSRQSGPLHQ
jgi:hypothetical protein